MLAPKERILSEVCFALARTAHTTKQYPAAEHWYKNVLELEPDNFEAEYALIYPLALQHKYPEALEQCNKALKGPHATNTLYTRALINLGSKNYIEGFEDLETRFELGQKLAPDFDMPKWNGESCKTLHVYGEQGFGDIIMFSRYVGLIKEKFNVEKIYFQVRQPIYSLFKYNFRNNSEVEVINDNTKIEADYTVNLVSCARIFKTTYDTVPPIKLEAEPEYIEKWKDKLAPYVAVCYGGRNTPDFQAQEWNSHRNVPEELLGPVIRNYCNYWPMPLQKELNPRIETWSDTAGILANSAFCITVDTGPAHLACAMGVRTFLLNHVQTCWRWNIEGEKTPWYGDHLTILRQVTEGDWTAPIEQLKAYLNG